MRNNVSNNQNYNNNSQISQYGINNENEYLKNDQINLRGNESRLNNNSALE